MRCRIKYIIRLFYTLRDVGVKRLCLRIKYEFWQLIDKQFPFKVAIFLTKGSRVKFKFKRFKNKYSLFINENLIKENKKEYFENLKLNILNEQIALDKINWENKKLSRLVRFNLHYFDFARNLLDKAIDKKFIGNEYFLIEKLMNEWIDNTATNFGDGWHSYTTSLRIRNWLWIFQFCPELSSPKKIYSLWLQICWLKNKPEIYHGGNHWLENIITLCQSSLQFENIYSNEIFDYAFKNLKDELPKQILNDGGHEERSATYHIIILDRLVELCCLLKIYRKEIPFWLIMQIQNMNNWLENVRLINGNYPLFNDNIIENCPNIDDVYFFTKGFIQNKCYAIAGLRGALLSLSLEKDIFAEREAFINKKEILDLKSTGWTIFTLGNRWELIFKCGIPCPNHLAAHVHSDQLSFELLKNGKKIICERGTSTYENSAERFLERSVRSHNTIQLGFRKRGKVEWIEPIDVWGVFRAGRKSKPLKKDFGTNKIWKWVIGSHNGYEHLNSFHSRLIAFHNNKEDKPIIVVIDRFNISKKSIMFRGWIHLAPFFSDNKKNSQLRFLFGNSMEIYKFKTLTKKSYLSKGYEKKVARETIQLSGELSKGFNTLITIISDPKFDFDFQFFNAYEGKIYVNGGEKISWNHLKDEYNFSNNIP